MSRPTIPTEGPLTTLIPIRDARGEVVSETTVTYIASSEQYPYFATDVALPQTIDDAEAKFGTEIYQHMYDTEPVLQAAVRGLKTLALGSGITIASAIDQPDDDDDDPQAHEDFGKADQAKRYIEWILADLAQRKNPFKRVLYGALDCIYLGHRLIEATREDIQRGEFKGKVGLKGLRVKPRRNYSLVVDTVDYTFRGVTAKIPGGPGIVWTGIVGDASKNSWIISPEKVILLSLEDHEGNPNGYSWFRSAYVPFKAKQAERPERLKTAGQFGGGMIWATAPPDREGLLYVDPNAPSGADPTLTAEQVTQSALSQLRNGIAVTFLSGTEAHVQQPSADPKFFESETSAYEREMVMAVMVTARAVLEAKHGSKADSEEAGDLVDEVVNHLRTQLSDAFRYQLFYPLVAASFGEDFADKYTPNLVLSPTKSADQGAVITALAQAGYLFSDDQMGWLDENVANVRRRQKTAPRADTQEVDGGAAAGFPVRGTTELGRAKDTGPVKRAGGKDGPRAGIDARSLRQIDAGRARKAFGPQRRS